MLFKYGEDWTEETLQRTWEAIDVIGKELGLDYYSPQIEIITSDQMIQHMAQIGMPVGYYHWRTGKEYIKSEKAYKKGQSGLAYEIVVNTDPCLTYIMENNAMPLQAVVLAHASVGHSHFFKNNYLFQEFTDASAIIPYLQYAQNYVSQCEERYGKRRVELFLDACHALESYGVDKYNRAASMSEENLKHRKEYLNKLLSEEQSHIVKNKKITSQLKARLRTVGKEDKREENILYFIQKNSKKLKPWQKELIRIVRMIAQYFYPQAQTKIMNEGFATHVHYEFMKMMYDRKLIDTATYMDTLHKHTGVVCQHANSQLNPYAIGFAIFQDIKRACENPDEEDLALWPQICYTDSWTTIKDIVANYRDSSFIRQWLGPKVVREFQLAVVLNTSTHLEITAIHDELDKIRQVYSEWISRDTYTPNLEVVTVIGGELVLRVSSVRDFKLNPDNLQEMCTYLEALWGGPVTIEYGI